MKENKVPIWKQPIVQIPYKIGKILLLVVLWIGRKMWAISSAMMSGTKRFWGRKYRKWD